MDETEPSTDESERRILLSIPEDIKSALTDQQLSTLLRAVKPIPTRHGFAVRSSFRGIENRYYVAFFMGEDRRNVERLRAEGQMDAIPVGGTFLILFAIIGLYGLFPVVMMLYLIKSALGIDFFDGPSPIHNMICG